MRLLFWAILIMMHLGSSHAMANTSVFTGDSLSQTDADQMNRLLRNYNAAENHEERERYANLFRQQARAHNITIDSQPAQKLTDKQLYNALDRQKAYVKTAGLKNLAKACLLGAALLCNMHSMQTTGEWDLPDEREMEVSQPIAQGVNQ